MSKEFEEHCDKKGIVRKRPQQNGSAENGNKVIGERITSMLAEANLPMQFLGRSPPCTHAHLESLSHICTQRQKPHMSCGLS